MNCLRKLRTFVRITLALLLGVLGHFLHAERLAATAHGAERPYSTASNTCNDSWLDGPPVNGAGGRVTAIARDNTGNVYVSGHFRSAGDKIVENIARWDGSNWSSMGAGLATGAEAMVVVGTDVYVSERYIIPGGVSDSPISKWDGSMWSPVGSGALQGGVTDLAVSGSTIYASSLRNRGGDDWLASVSAWNGIAWAPLGSEISYQRIMNLGLSLAVSGTNVYIGGRFYRPEGIDQILRWNGTGWTGLGNPFTGEFSDLAVSGTDIYAAGNDNTQRAGSVVKWNGTRWEALGQVTKPERYPWVDILAIEAAGTDVYIAGHFSLVDGTPAQGTARWDGTRWYGIGSWNGVGETYLPPGQIINVASVRAIAISGQDVYFGGTFSSPAGLLRADGVAKWDGSRWSALGSGKYRAPAAFAKSGTDLYAAGYFTNDGGATSSRVAKWNATDWTPLPSWTTPGADTAQFIEAIAVSGSSIYVGGGSQDPATGAHRGFVQHWNGSGWSQLGSGMTGPSWPHRLARVYALAVVNDVVYAGGDFTDAGGTSASMIARWSGNGWSPLNTGVNAPVYALATSDNDLYVGGLFDNFYGLAGNRIARWNNSGWTAVGGISPRSLRPASPDLGYRAVTDIELAGSEIYTAGGWDPSDYEDVGFMSKWNGSQWSDVIVSFYITALAFSGSEIYAAGGVDDGIASWNGSTWASIDSGSAGWNVGDMTVANGQLFVAGNFADSTNHMYTAGCHVSAHYARYSLGLPASVSGRVMTPDGRSLRNAVVSITDPAGIMRTTTTSSFGNYRFENVSIGGSYSIGVSSKRYRFSPRSVAVNNDLANVDFVGLE